ncbi:hypothetical protein ACQKKO_03440 [Alkalihalobacillus sp. NPDC127517]
MKVEIKITCDCGNELATELKRTFQEYEGKVYEDYSEISESINDALDSFKASTNPDTVYVTCMKCEKRHEIIT